MARYAVFLEPLPLHGRASLLEHILSLTKSDNVTFKFQLPFLQDGDIVTNKKESQRLPSLILGKIIIITSIVVM
jgi:hypothetical protein